MRADKIKTYTDIPALSRNVEYPPLPSRILKRLEELDGKNTKQESSASIFGFFVNLLNDLTTPRVGGPAFASLLVGIISTSVLFQYTNSIISTPLTDVGTRGAFDASVYELSSNQNGKDAINSGTPRLFQSGELIQSNGALSEGLPWTVSAQSIFDGTATLLNIDSDGTSILLDTQPAYEGLFFTFKNFQVTNQTSLNLRVRIVSEDLTTEISYNLSYTIQ